MFGSAPPHITCNRGGHPWPRMGASGPPVQRFRGGIAGGRPRSARRCRLVGVGPVRLLEVLALVVDGAAVGQVDQLRKDDRPRAWTPSLLEMFGELLGKGPQHAGHRDLLFDGEIAAV